MKNQHCRAESVKGRARPGQPKCKKKGGVKAINHICDWYFEHLFYLKTTLNSCVGLFNDGKDYRYGGKKWILTLHIMVIPSEQKEWFLRYTQIQVYRLKWVKMFQAYLLQSTKTKQWQVRKLNL